MPLSSHGQEGRLAPPLAAVPVAAAVDQGGVVAGVGPDDTVGGDL